jgi:hypothetical protein
VQKGTAGQGTVGGMILIGAHYASIFIPSAHPKKTYRGQVRDARKRRNIKSRLPMNKK